MNLPFALSLSKGAESLHCALTGINPYVTNRVLYFSEGDSKGAPRFYFVNQQLKVEEYTAFW